MITDTEIAECRKVLLRYGMFSDGNVDEIVEVAKQIVIQTNHDPTGSQLLDAAALIISISNVGYSGDKLKEEIEKATLKLV